MFNPEEDESITHGEKTGATSDDIILSPQPSLDPNDPCSTVFSGFSTIEDTVGISYATLTQGTGYLYGFYGWGGCLIVPLALKFGHRPVYLGTALVVFGMCIWVPWITTNGQWIASRIIYGTFGSPCESLNEVSISMMYFSHERGYYLGFYSIALYAGAFLAPACSGYLFNAGGLSAVMYFTSGVAALCFFIIFFLFEEVSYNHRPEFSRSPRVAGDKSNTSRSNSPHASEKETATAVVNSTEPVRLGQDRGLVGKSHSYLYTLGMFREIYCTNRQWFDAMWRPVYMVFAFPCIFYAGFSLGTVLNAPPYNFGSGAVGLVYLGPLLAACFAGPLTGALGDRMVIRAARKNGGIREPEPRLWLNVFNVAIVPPAFVLWGVGATHGVHWFGLEVALTCIGAFVVVQATISAAFVLDSYKEMALEVMVAAVLVRNTLSFAIGYAVAPWLEGLGVQNMNLSMGFAGAAFCALFLPVIWKGKYLRNQTKGLFWRLAATTPIQH
ncbi:hypothetical protein JCM6882_004695 [Rhodosporidiobolus microsporus]